MKIDAKVFKFCINFPLMIGAIFCICLIERLVRKTILVGGYALELIGLAIIYTGGQLVDN